MFVRIKNTYINLSLITGVYENKSGTCIIYCINKNTYDIECTLDEFIKEIEKQAMLPINKLFAKSSIQDRFNIQDRFKLMDLEE